MSDRIRYNELKDDIFKVIKIIDDFTLMVNAGKEDGYQVGDEFEIFIKGSIITDPDNPEIILGSLDKITGKVKIDILYDHISICTSNEYSPSAMASIISMNQRTFSETKKRLNVNSEDIEPVLSPDDLKIHIGSKIRLSRQS